VRKAAIEALSDLADSDDRLVLLTGDLGFMVIEPFADRHPGRFINVGVAEANMVGIATGLALEGMRPYCYSIATFAVLRPYEQLRNGAHGHDLQVRIIGVGGGFGYGPAGYSHHALEDIAVLRALPRMRIVVPSDDRDTGAAIRQLHAAPGPTYFRLAKDSRVLRELSGEYQPAVLQTVGEGSVLLIAVGTIADQALAAQAWLGKRGVEIRVAIATTIAPFPVDHLLHLLDASSLVVTLEDHVLAGGLGSLVAEIMADHGSLRRLHRVGVRDTAYTALGSEHYMRTRAGLDGVSVGEWIESLDAVRLIKLLRTRVAALQEAEVPTWCGPWECLQDAGAQRRGRLTATPSERQRARRQMRIDACSERRLESSKHGRRPRRRYCGVQ